MKASSWFKYGSRSDVDGVLIPLDQLPPYNQAGDVFTIDGHDYDVLDVVRPAHNGHREFMVRKR